MKKYCKSNKNALHKNIDKWERDQFQGWYYKYDKSIIPVTPGLNNKINQIGLDRISLKSTNDKGYE